LEQTKLLLEHGANLNVVTPEGANALHLAAAAGRIELSKFLIAKGIGIDTKSKAGTTPLFGAVVSGSKDLVGELITKGADVNTVGSEGQTPLDLAIILDNDREQSAFRGARNADPKGVLELLKAHGARPGATSSN
jgi:ankyrin repeat protein